jgi:hypothetical protein
MFVLASDVGSLLASGISVMILAGIYTTVVPLLWTVSSRFFADKTPRFKCPTIALAAVGTVIGLLLPFSKMVNLVYVIYGYVGILLLVLMLVKTGTWTARRRSIRPRLHCDMAVMICPIEARAGSAFAVGAVGMGALLPGDLGAVPDEEA